MQNSALRFPVVAVATFLMGGLAVAGGATPLEAALMKAGLHAENQGTLKPGSLKLSADDILAEYHAAAVPACYSEFLAASVASNAIQAKYLATSPTDLVALQEKSNFASAFQENLKDLDRLESDECRTKEAVLKFVALVEARAFNVLHPKRPDSATALDAPQEQASTSLLTQVTPTLLHVREQARQYTDILLATAALVLGGLLLIAGHRAWGLREARALLTETHDAKVCPHCGQHQLKLKSKKTINKTVEYEHKKFVGAPTTGKPTQLRRTDTRKVIKYRFLLTFKCANCKETSTKEKVRTVAGLFVKGEWQPADASTMHK